MKFWDFYDVLNDDSFLDDNGQEMDPAVVQDLWRIQVNSFIWEVIKGQVGRLNINVALAKSILKSRTLLPYGPFY